MLVGLWLMPGVCRLSVLGSCMSHCWCLFLGIVVSQEKERSRIRALQVDNLRGLQGVRRMDKVVVRGDEKCR